MSLDIHSMQELVGDMSINFSGAIEALREKIESFIMTSPFSQSGLNGYEGSSACAVIAIATGCVFSRETVRRPLKEMAKAFVGCIEFGNGVYQEADYLTPHEAIMLLPSHNISIHREKNWFLPQLQDEIIEHFKVTSSRGFVLIVTKE